MIDDYFIDLNEISARIITDNYIPKAFFYLRKNMVYVGDTGSATDFLFQYYGSLNVPYTYNLVQSFRAVYGSMEPMTYMVVHNPIVTQHKPTEYYSFHTFDNPEELSHFLRSRQLDRNCILNTYTVFFKLGKTAMGRVQNIIQEGLEGFPVGTQTRTHKHVGLQLSGRFHGVTEKELRYFEYAKIKLQERDVTLNFSTMTNKFTISSDDFKEAIRLKITFPKLYSEVTKVTYGNKLIETCFRENQDTIFENKGIEL